MRQIRSFVRRMGRLTRRQEDALKIHWQTWGLRVTPDQDHWDLATVFGSPIAHLLLEIGFGKGEALLNFAMQHSDWCCLGVDVHVPGLGAVLQQIEQKGLSNIRLVGQDVCEVLKWALPDASLHEVRIFFPDPWPKKRHHKRRLIQASFLDLLYPKLVEGGRIHLATDWQDYAVQMQSVFGADPRWRAVTTLSLEDLRSARVGTRFESRGLQRGHTIYDLMYERL